MALHFVLLAESMGWIKVILLTLCVGTREASYTCYVMQLLDQYAESLCKFAKEALGKVCVT